MKLSHVAAVLSGKKTETEKVVGELNKLVQKETLFNGYTKSYSPYREATNPEEAKAGQLPAENVAVQQRARDLLVRAKGTWASLMDLTLTQDSGNTTAIADIFVDGDAWAKGVPITTLMFLQKQVADVKKFVENLPTPDPAIPWQYDPAQGLLRSKEAQVTQRTQKALRALVKYEATDKHPAQTEAYTVDVPIGEWRKDTFFGGVLAKNKEESLWLIHKLEDAIKVARETANDRDAPQRKIGEVLLDRVLAPLLSTV